MSHAECEALAAAGEAAAGEAAGEAAALEARLAGAQIHIVAAVVRRAPLRLRQHLPPRRGSDRKRLTAAGEAARLPHRTLPQLTMDDIAALEC